MKFFITGAAGYLGSTLCGQLLKQGHQVTALDNLMYGQATSLFPCAESHNFTYVHGDVRDTELITKLGSQADVIIPLACLVGAPLCNNNPLDAKSINTDHVIELSKLGKKLIYPTTNSGYGVGGEEECTEESPLNPLSVYGTTKVEAEDHLLTNKSGVCFRLATVFGASPRQRLDLLVNDFVVKAKRDGCLVLFEQHFRRNYIHIKDVCNAFIFAVDHYAAMKGETYNVGLTSANLTKRELAEKVKEHLPSTVIISSEIGEDPDKRDYLVSNQKLESLGWRPLYTLDDGIKEICKVYDMVKGSGDIYRNY